MARFQLHVAVVLVLSVLAIALASTPVGAYEISVALGADPISLDPRKTWVGPGYSINAHIFEPLVFRRQDGDRMEVVGVLAEEIERVDDLTWRFKIREEVTFHNGVPLTAEAVKFTYESILDPNFITPLEKWLEDVARIWTEGDYVLLIETKYPTRGLLSALAQVPIVEPGAAQSMGSLFDRTPVGTGPYKIVEYVPDNRVVVERYDGYWGEPGKPSRINFYIRPENSVRLAMLETGEVHIAEAMPADRLNLLQNHPDLDLIYTSTLRVIQLVLETDRPWLNDVRFRQALSYAIDREAIVEFILGGTAQVASSVSPPGTFGFNSKLPPYQYNPEKARQLLEEVGYDGSVITMGAPSGRYAMDRQIAESVALMLQEVGVNVSLEVSEWSSFRPKTMDGRYAIWYIGSADLTINPTNHWRSQFHCSSNDYSKYCNPEVDYLMDTAISTFEDAEAIAMYHRAQEILYEEMPHIPLFYEPQLIGVRAEVEGFVPRLDEYVIVRDVRLRQ